MPETLVIRSTPPLVLAAPVAEVVFEAVPVAAVPVVCVPVVVAALALPVWLAALAVVVVAYTEALML
jgi:hypothetical protein